jgi:hypothetical protein
MWTRKRPRWRSLLAHRLVWTSHLWKQSFAYWENLPSQTPRNFRANTRTEMRQWIAVLEHHIAQKDPAKPGTDTLDDVCCPH